MDDLISRQDDLISRQAMLELVKKYFEFIELNPDLIVDSIISLPSAQPKTAKWLLNGGRPCECSVCHHEGNEYGDARFCAYCGAMMKEGEER